MIVAQFFLLVRVQELVIYLWFVEIQDMLLLLLLLLLEIQDM